MILNLGRLPERVPYAITARPGSRRVPAILSIVAAFAAACTAYAQPTPLTLAQAEDAALAAEPGRLGLQARAAALEARAIVAGELPDPVLRIGLNNYPMESGGFTTEGMTNAGASIRQAFPAGRTRAIRETRFRLLAREMNETADARVRGVLASVRGAWLDVYYWSEAAELVQSSTPFFRDLADVTRSLYSVGRKSQQDVLRAQLELSKLEDRLIEIERQRRRARAVLGEWIGAEAERPLARNLPAWDGIPPLEDLRGSLAGHPSVKASDARIAARQAGVDLAEERAKPGWALDVAYSYRDGRLSTGDPRSDFVSLNVSIDLPFFRRDTIDGTLSSALEERSAARFARQQLLRELDRELDVQHAHWQELTRREDLYETRILRQAGDHADASLLAYQNDVSDFADVMRAYIDELDTRLAHLRVRVDRARTYAVLADLGGFPR